MKNIKHNGVKRNRLMFGWLSVIEDWKTQGYTGIGKKNHKLMLRAPEAMDELAMSKERARTHKNNLLKLDSNVMA